MNSPGLRERKKQKTRWAIQEHALRLFAEQGYESTTIDQIAAAAEISPSTFFRYFPTKEDLVIEDEYDDIFLTALRSAPAELAPLAALREIMRATFGEMSPRDREKILERTRLTMSVPSLRARSLQNMLNTFGVLREGIGSHTGRDPGDFEVRVLVGAVVGALVAALEMWIEQGGHDDLAELADGALAKLEAGLTL